MAQDPPAKSNGGLSKIFKITSSSAFWDFIDMVYHHALSMERKETRTSSAYMKEG
jgi:hypothetical protein